MSWSTSGPSSRAVPAITGWPDARPGALTGTRRGRALAKIRPRGRYSEWSGWSVREQMLCEGGACFRPVTGRRLTVAVEAGQSSEGTVRTELRENAVGLPGMLMQGIATIAPSFAILASFVFIVSNAGIVTPWAYLFGGALLCLQAVSAAQLARVFPSAGGWYTWIARALLPRAGFFAGVLFSVWLPPVGALTLSYLAKVVLEPSIKSEYDVTIYWWIWVLAGLALVIYFAYQGIVLSEKGLIITGTIEIVIMVALALSGLASPGPGGFSFAPLNPGNFGLATNLFLGVVFSIFAFSGWESTGPLAEESKNPKRNVPIGLVGSVIILMIYFVFVTW